MRTGIAWGLSGGVLGLCIALATLQPAVAQGGGHECPEVKACQVVDRESLKAFVEGSSQSWAVAAMQGYPAEVLNPFFRAEGGCFKSGSVYIAVATRGGKFVFHGANPALDQQNLYDAVDLNGVKFVQELIAAAEAGGGYVEYLFDNPVVEGDEENGSPKVSYAKAFDSVDSEDGEPLIMVSGFYEASRLFIPAVLSSAGMSNSFFTSELTLTNRGANQARLRYSYVAHSGEGSGTASDVLASGQQKIVGDTIEYLRELGLPIPDSGKRIGTLTVEAFDAPQAGVVVRTTTAVPEGRAGLAYLGIPGNEGFHDEAVFLGGLRQNQQDRSNVALQNMGTEGSITLRTTVFSGSPADSTGLELKDVTLAPGGFYQFNGVLGDKGDPRFGGYVKVERVEGSAPFYAYGVINDQANSDGSFVFPVSESSLAESMGQVLPVVLERGSFTSELMLTNFSDQAKTMTLSLVADAIQTEDHTATLSLPPLAAGQQYLIPNVIAAARQQFGVDLPSGLSGSLFASAVAGDLGGIMIGARTGSPGGGGQYSVFYHAVPQGAGFTESAWVDGLQQNEESRSNLALVNTGEVEASPSVFNLEVYDGDTGLLAETVTGITVAPRGWHQINGILGSYAPGTRQGYIRILKVSGENPFLAYGVVNDGGAPGERTGDGAYLPAREPNVPESNVVVADSGNWGDDPYVVNSAAVNGHRLNMEVSYAGGCRKHVFTLVLSTSFIESDPVRLPAVLAHDANGDPCEAWVTRAYNFDLALVRTRYRQFYGPGPGKVVLQIKGVPQNDLVYEFTE